MKPYEIAQICHEANRALCQINGDDSQKPWIEAPDWQRASAINGVVFVIKNPHLGLSAQHDNWRLEKEKAGWIYGKEKDENKKTHPCLVDFEALPKNQQNKDALFKAIILALDE
jgi:hypothetical protein